MQKEECQGLQGRAVIGPGLPQGCLTWLRCQIQTPQSAGIPLPEPLPEAEAPAVPGKLQGDEKITRSCRNTRNFSSSLGLSSTKPQIPGVSSSVPARVTGSCRKRLKLHQGRFRLGVREHFPPKIREKSLDRSAGEASPGDVALGTGQGWVW